jgi:hypothetical protein
MNYATAAKSHIGRSVIMAGLTLAITALSDKTGKLKNGTDAPYLELTGPDGHKEMLHPRTAATLFSKGEATGIKMLIAAVEPTETIHHPTTVAAKPKAKAVVAPVDVPATKKAQALAIFNEVVAAHGTRAEVIKRIMGETGSSLNLANTYYQNMRGGKWG